MNRVGPKIIVGLMSLSSLALVGGLSPAQAQFWGHPPPQYDLRDELSPRELGRAAIAQGFEIVSQPRYGDEYATATARDRSGRPVRLTMDAFSGQIVNVRALAAAQPERPVARAPARERIERYEEPARRPEPEKRREAATPKAPPATVAAPPSPRVVAPTAPGDRATPERPTVIRREPLLPAPATPPAAAQPPAAQAPAAVGSGTRTAPRRIDIVPSTGDAPGGSTPPL